MFLNYWPSTDILTYLLVHDFKNSTFEFPLAVIYDHKSSWIPIHTAVVRSEVHSEAGAAAVSDRQEGDRLEGNTP